MGVVVGKNDCTLNPCLHVPFINLKKEQLLYFTFNYFRITNALRILKFIYLYDHFVYKINNTSGAQEVVQCILGHLQVFVFIINIVLFFNFSYQ